MLSFGQVWADLAPTVMLSHNGNKKFYMYDEIQNAVDDAVDGDTIYLSEGAFSPFNVDKRIMVRGAGSTTIIGGDCEINISGEEKLSMPVLDAMCFNGNVIVKSAYKQFTLRKCKMKNLKWSTDKEFWDTKIDRCWFGVLNIPGSVKEFNAFNCRIEDLYCHDTFNGQATFDHCNILDVWDTIYSAVLNSCVISRCTKVSGAPSNACFIGCVINSCIYNKAETKFVNCSIVDCSTVSYSTSTDGGYFASNYYNSKEISNLDNTPKGAYGGQHPFTLNPEVPGVTKYNISIDAANKKMTVNLTVDKLK